MSTTLQAYFALVPYLCRYTSLVSDQCLPFIKWAGGKRKVTSLLQGTFPLDFFSNRRNYFEPFVGGGALALSLGDGSLEKPVPGDRIHINDMNPDLVKTYEVIRDSLPQLIQKLDLLSSKFLALELPSKELAADKSLKLPTVKFRDDFYYEVRAQTPENDIDTAARLIFLNKTCFNGLWRVNSRGKFNVPYGHHKNPSLYSLENLEECSRRLQGAEISHLEFHDAVATAEKGDLVYFDPPYIPLNPTSSFSQYSKNDFGINEQKLLANTIGDLTKRGVYVILSNSDTPLTREIFGDVVSMKRLLMSRFISATASKREPVYELIGVNFEIPLGSTLHDFESV